MVYVYIMYVVDDYSENISVSVFDTIEKAQKALKEDRDKVIDYWADDEDSVIGEDTPNCFNAYEDGYAARNQDNFYIVEREIL